MRNKKISKINTVKKGDKKQLQILGPEQWPVQPSPIDSVVQQQVTLTTSLEDSQENEYYNFPPRHPRHGHLKWPIWKPIVTSEESFVHESICITTYPDYPVHLSTFTLKRVASVIKTRAQKGRGRFCFFIHLILLLILTNLCTYLLCLLTYFVAVINLLLKYLEKGILFLICISIKKGSKESSIYIL